MEDMRKEGYFTGWQYNNPNNTKEGSHRIYYNDIDIATGNLICDGEIVGSAMNVDRHMQNIDKVNNYMW